MNFILTSSCQLQQDNADFIAVKLCPVLCYILPSSKHFKYEYSQSPYIHPIVMASIQYNLWSCIVWGSTKGPCLITITNFFSKTKINLLQTTQNGCMLNTWMNMGKCYEHYMECAIKCNEIILCQIICYVQSHLPFSRIRFYQ